jgi:sensor histidine kinase YesM
MLGLFFLRVTEADVETITGWGIVIPCAIAFYLFSFHYLIPRSLAHNNYKFFFYFLKTAFIAFISFIVIFLLITIISGDDDCGAGYSAFNSFFQVFITAPVTWALYKRFQKGNEEVRVLQTELKRSSASVDFLRSQINPHFLFNALNTLYGTAIQENADRTSEGIQRLGDMMRFMLQENMQDKISLAREIEYLNNYIDLQKLRTDTSPNIQIQTEIQDRENIYQIAPMLLIPFVENAFKHGISFREPSHIKITLEIKDKTLYFDVYNSKHSRPDNDPEKDKSGIGLENVKQRLKLSYPNKHELIIRDTTKEFFVHLTLQLAKSA